MCICTYLLCLDDGVCCSISDAIQWRKSRSIAHFHPQGHYGILCMCLIGQLAMIEIPVVLVGVALHEGSDISEELRCAVAIEIVDWLIQTNWTGQV